MYTLIRIFQQLPNYFVGYSFGDSLFLVLKVWLKKKEESMARQ